MLPDCYTAEFLARRTSPEKAAGVSISAGRTDSRYRVDNDLRPTISAGMHTALVRRGPWGTIQWNTDEARDLPTFRIVSLLELPEQIIKFNGPAH